MEISNFREIWKVMVWGCNDVNVDKNPDEIDWSYTEMCRKIIILSALMFDNEYKKIILMQFSD